jgi:DNA-binding NarL/FixJ family response regulator
VVNRRREVTRQKRLPPSFIQRSLESLEQHAERLSPPTPLETAEFVDWLEFMLSQLDQRDPSGRLRDVARLKLEGYTDAEIAERQACSRKTVSMRLALIRVIWKTWTE